MKRSSIVRGLLIIVVLALASMTTGCLKASVDVAYEYDDIVVQEGVPLEGEFTFTLTGVLAAGMYNSMLVSWLDAAGTAIQPAAGEDTQFDISIPIAPVGSFRQGTLDLAEVNDGAGVMPSVNCFGDAGPVAKVKFTFVFTGLGVKPSTIEIPVADI